MQVNKTDANDAEGIAQIMRTGWYREVVVKAFETHHLHSLKNDAFGDLFRQTRLDNTTAPLNN